MLKNKELVAINQDPLGKPGRLIQQTTNSTDGTVAITNIVEQVFSREINATFSSAGFGAGAGAGAARSGSTVSEARAVVLFNRGEVARNMTVTWTDLGLCGGSTEKPVLPEPPEPSEATVTKNTSVKANRESGISCMCQVRDIWTHNEFGEDKGTHDGMYSAEVPKHGVVTVVVACH